MTNQASSTPYSRLRRNVPTAVEATRPVFADMTVERLPFAVRIARNTDDLNKAVKIRHVAYARHVPEFAEQLRAPEVADDARGVIVLLAESKADGSPLGTMRVQTNQYGPLSVEQSVILPPSLQNRSIAEATRLGIAQGHGGRLVKTALFKAFYEFCLRNKVNSMLATGRAPIDRQYEQLMFNDIGPGKAYIPLLHVGNLPHRVMTLDVQSVEPLWSATKHPLYNFFFRTHHPDIDTDADKAPRATMRPDESQADPVVSTVH